jgi:hypothetical protein
MSNGFKDFKVRFSFFSGGCEGGCDGSRLPFGRFGDFCFFIYSSSRTVMWLT